MNNTVFLNKIPIKFYRGKLKDKPTYDWSASIGHKVKFIYEDIEGEIEIVDYDSKKQKLHIKYLDKDPFEIKINHFYNCHLGKLLGKITNKFKIEIGSIFKDNNRDLIIVNREYRKGNNGQDLKWYKYKCNKCGYDEGWIVESSLLSQKSGCVCCSPYYKKGVLGINTIWDTDKWMYDLGVSEEDAKKYTKSSSKKITVTCPDCGKAKKITISDIYSRRSISCICNDGKSYSEKFISNILTQLQIDFQTQYQPKWCKNISHVNPKLNGSKIYDFYTPLFGNIIIEAQGIQHYEEQFSRIKSNRKARTLQEEQENDKIKKELAEENNINKYIVIDCRKSQLEYIKNNILNSELNALFDLSVINWIKAEEFALSNLCKRACQLKRDAPDITATKIAIILKLDRSTIRKYLKQGAKLNWCVYNPSQESFITSSKNGKANGKKIQIYKDNKLIDTFSSISELERESEVLFGTKLFKSAISRVCLKKQQEHKGYTFAYCT